MSEAKRPAISNLEMPSDKSIFISDVERKRITESMERTDTEKFFLFTRLMRIHLMLKNAVIIK